jgi:hypothetical protein
MKTDRFHLAYTICLDMMSVLSRAAVILLLAVIFAQAVTMAAAQTLKRQLITEKGSDNDDLIPHPLSWWTENPLRLDSSGDLMLGYNAPDGQPLTAKDYSVDVQVIPVGTLAGHKILEVRTTFHPGPRVIASGWAPKDGSAPEWKDLLITSGPDGKYVDLYALHYDQSGLIRLQAPAIYGTGPGAILGTFDPDTGNGGGCFDGYWWVDASGPHAVDFSPLVHAVSRAIPANATYASHCRALHLDSMELKSWVQRSDAECHACGGLGQVFADFRIKKGVALPASVRFEPGQP